jgi:hypothetical protein
MNTKSTLIVFSTAIVLGASAALAGDNDNTRQTEGFSASVGPLGQMLGTPPAPTGGYAYGFVPTVRGHHPAAKDKHAR